MDQDKQTLLEAAKDTIVWWGIGSMPDQIRALKAAIAREEAKGVKLSDLRAELAEDRAEKAEAELAKLRAHVAKSLSMPPESTTDDLIDTDLVVLTSVINDLARTGLPLPLKVRDAMPQVVDELLRLRAELEERREDGVVTAQDVCDLRARAMRAEAELAEAKSDTRAKIQDELRSIERALCSADVLIKFAALPRGCYEGHVHNTIETAISALRDDAATPPYSPPFEGDPKACAFKPAEPKVGIVRDPVTGWTFATYRRVVEALGDKS